MACQKVFSINHLEETIIDTILNQHPVVPVVTFSATEQAEPVAAALASAGIGILEVALRSDAALDAITVIRKQVPDMLVGAGTVRRTSDFQRIYDAGAQFAVSPGTTDELLKEAKSRDMPYLPAAATVSEMMRLSELGYRTIKFFPAESMGGIATLKAVNGPLPELSFCPSGGIGEKHLIEWLQLDNVVSVSGSWLTPARAMEDRKWTRIEELARTTVQLLNQART